MLAEQHRDVEMAQIISSLSSERLQHLERQVELFFCIAQLKIRQQRFNEVYDMIRVSNNIFSLTFSVEIRQRRHVSHMISFCRAESKTMPMKDTARLAEYLR